MIEKPNCHKCQYLRYSYLSELTFLYGCVDDVALTTKELQKISGCEDD